jgi:Aminopeptidase P, N-terminal domain
MTASSLSDVGESTSISAQLERRRSAVAELWNLTDEIVLVGAGDPLHVPGRGDRTYPFHAHSEYFYLTDRSRPGGVLAFDPHDGWTQFVQPASEAELLWTSVGLDESELSGLSVDGLDDWLAARADRTLAWLGSPVANRHGDEELARTCRAALNQVRRRKDAVELAQSSTSPRRTASSETASSS